MDILQSRLFETGESCFFIVASIDYPFVYTRFKGIIMKRQIQNDNIEYNIRVTNVLENKQYILAFIHRKMFRVKHILSSRGDLKQLSCFDLTLNMTNFDLNFEKRYKHIGFPTSSVFVYENENDMNTYLDKSIHIMKSHLEESSKILESRILMK